MAYGGKNVAVQGVAGSGPKTTRKHAGSPVLSTGHDYEVVVGGGDGFGPKWWTEVPVQPTGATVGPVVGRSFTNSSVLPGARFIWVSGGSFKMGSTDVTDPSRNIDEVQHWVTVSGFWLLDHEVTQGEFRNLVRHNPSRLQGDSNRPVEQVSWIEAVAFCDELTRRDREAGRIRGDQRYRLPTESEWEYAARAGEPGPRHGVLDLIAWWSGNSLGQTNPVGGKYPNKWGFYDMIGNVSEWCFDWYGAYPVSVVQDPRGPTSGSFRVIRGGSWFGDGVSSVSLRLAARTGMEPVFREGWVGFRLALSSVR
ncbi:MAG: formylglycine-generating enzyme family protein [Verrucomicrobiota bacterium]